MFTIVQSLISKLTPLLNLVMQFSWNCFCLKLILTIGWRCGRRRGILLFKTSIVLRSHWYGFWPWCWSVFTLYVLARLVRLANVFSSMTRLAKSMEFFILRTGRRRTRTTSIVFSTPFTLDKIKLLKSLLTSSMCNDPTWSKFQIYSLPKKMFPDSNRKFKYIIN